MRERHRAHYIEVGIKLSHALRVVVVVCASVGAVLAETLLIEQTVEIVFRIGELGILELCKNHDALVVALYGEVAHAHLAELHLAVRCSDPLRCSPGRLRQQCRSLGGLLQEKTVGSRTLRHTSCNRRTLNRKRAVVFRHEIMVITVAAFLYGIAIRCSDATAMLITHQQGSNDGAIRLHAFDLATIGGHGRHDKHRACHDSRCNKM